MTDTLLPGWRRCVHCGAAYVPTGLRQLYCPALDCQRARRAKYTRTYRARLANAQSVLANS